MAVSIESDSGPRACAVLIGRTMRSQRDVQSDNRLMLRPNEPGTTAAHTARFVAELDTPDPDDLSAETVMAYADIKAFIEGGRPLFVPKSAAVPTAVKKGPGGTSSSSDVALFHAPMRASHQQARVFNSRPEWRELSAALSVPSPLVESFPCSIARLFLDADSPAVVRPPLRLTDRDSVLASAAERQGEIPPPTVTENRRQGPLSTADKATMAPRIPLTLLQAHGYATDNRALFSAVSGNNLAELAASSISAAESSMLHGGGMNEGVSAAVIDGIGAKDVPGAVMFEWERLRERSVAVAGGGGRNNNYRRGGSAGKNPGGSTTPSPSSAGGTGGGVIAASHVMTGGVLASPLSLPSPNNTGSPTSPTARVANKGKKSSRGTAAAGLSSSPTLGEHWTSVRGIVFRIRHDRCDEGHALYYRAAFAPLYSGRDITKELALWVTPTDTAVTRRLLSPRAVTPSPDYENVVPTTRPPNAVQWLGSSRQLMFTREEWEHIDAVFALFALHFDVIGVLEDGWQYW